MSQVDTACPAPGAMSVSGMPPVATITTSGPFGEHVGGLGKRVETYLDREPLELANPPITDPADLAPPRHLGSQHQLPARAIRRLEHDHLVPALGAHPGRFEARGPGPDHDDLATPRPDLAIAWGIVASRPVAGLWMHSVSSPM